MAEIRRLSFEEGQQHEAALADVLMDCVHGGASVGFMSEATTSDANGFFKGVLECVRTGSRILLAAFDDTALIGTVQVVTATMPNQQHRGEVAKLLVKRSARRRGVARELMTAAEDSARQVGKTLLVLDTVTEGDGERLYLSLGWTKSGVIPDYALFPNGSFCSTTIFWKKIG